MMNQQSETEIKSQLKQVLRAQNADIKRVAQIFKLSYSEAALLMLNFHLNALHTTAVFWEKANVKPVGTP